MRRCVLALLIASTLLAATGCSTSSGSKDKFCAAIPKTEDVMSILSDFSSTDPTKLQARFDDGLAQFRALEKAAPREIRADVSAVADAVEKILDVVTRHPDDLSAIRTELAGSAATFAKAGAAGQRVGDYAQDECHVDLGGTPPATGVTTTTTG